MALTIYEMCWLKYILHDIRISQENPMKLFSDGKTTIYIRKISVFYKKIKYIEVDYYFLREKIQSRIIIRAVFNLLICLLNM